MCEDWITEKYIDDVRNANQKNYAAVKRVREVIEKHWNENICSLSTYQEIIKALDGEK
jgi:hypothetical protein